MPTGIYPRKSKEIDSAKVAERFWGHAQAVLLGLNRGPECLPPAKAETVAGYSYAEWLSVAIQCASDGAELAWRLGVNPFSRRGAK